MGSACGGQASIDNGIPIGLLLSFDIYRSQLQRRLAMSYLIGTMLARQLGFPLIKGERFGMLLRLRQVIRQQPMTMWWFVILLDL